MKLHSSSTPRNALLALLALSSSALLQAQSLAITDIVWQTVGTSGATIVGSGVDTNTTTWNDPVQNADGDVGVFEINGGEFFMRVRATGTTGPV
jgi:hypothetical protein